MDLSVFYGIILSGLIMIMKTFSLSLLILFLPSVLFPLDEASILSEYHRVLSQNPEMASKTVAIKQNRFYIVEKGASLFYPEVGSSASASRSHTNYGGSFPTAKPEDDTVSYGGGVSIQYPLFRGFSDYHSWQKARVEAEVARQNWLLSAENLLQNWLVAFREYAVRDKNVTLSRQLSEESQTQLKMMLEKEKLQMAIRSDIALAKANAFQAESLVLQSENERQNALADLETLMNGEVRLPALEMEKLPEPNLPASWDEQKRPLMSLSELQIQLSRKDTSIARSAFYPSIDIGTGYNLLSVVRSDTDKTWRAEVSVNYSIFSGYRNRSRLQQSMLRTEALSSDKQSTCLDLQNAFVKAQRDQKNLIEQVKIQEELFLASEESYQAAKEELRLDVISFPEFVTIQTRWYEASTNLENAKIRLFFGNLNLKLLAGDYYPVFQQSLEARIKE